MHPLHHTHTDALSHTAAPADHVPIAVPPDRVPSEPPAVELPAVGVPPAFITTTADSMQMTSTYEVPPEVIATTSDSTQMTCTYAVPPECIAATSDSKQMTSTYEYLERLESRDRPPEKSGTALDGLKREVSLRSWRT